MTIRIARELSWWQFLAWACCGASSALIVLAAFTFGPLAVVAALLFAAVALLLGGANPSAVGAVAGVGVWAFVIGWLNRDGPGEVCTGSAANSSCTQEFAPWPSYIAGALMIGVAVVVFAVLQRRSARAR